jgi:hypothetical protein
MMQGAFMRRLFFIIVITAAAFSFIRADFITLKDGQKFCGDVRTFDRYYVTVDLPNAKTIAVPWGEVRLIEHSTTEADWREETYMNTDDTEVTTMVTPLSEDNAFMNSIFPGFIIHGSGHFYAKDQNTALSLMSAEIVSVIIMAISANGMLNNDTQDGTAAMSKVVFCTGLTMFAASWAWDMTFAKSAAQAYNIKHEFIFPQGCGQVPAEAAGNTKDVTK